MLFLRALVFYLGISLTMLIFVALSPPMLLFPYRWRYFYFTRWGRFTIWWLCVTCRVNFRVEGRENIPKATAIVLAKHQSAWETIVMQQIFPPQTWVLKRELFWIPFLGWALIMMRSVGIDRSGGKKALKQVISQGTQRLHDGLWMVIFPEGTRVSPGERGRYAIGGAMLAEKSGYPVVPVCHNAGEFWPKRGFVKYPGTITLIIGQPIDPQGKRAGEINAQAEEWIESTYQQITTLK